MRCLPSHYRLQPKLPINITSKDLMSIRIAAVITSFFFSTTTVEAVTDLGFPHIPFAFVENRGQASPLVRYIGTGPEFKAWFEDRGVILQHGNTAVKIAF